jgi:serine phosphatase RsbU (regulator of sigma subunit)
VLDFLTRCRLDLLVAFTDTRSEAIRASHEEWGVDRLIAALRTTYSAPSQVILMDSAVAFVAGAPQHDDMTLIVMGHLSVCSR